jgi:hypothetical protein
VRRRPRPESVRRSIGARISGRASAGVEPNGSTGKRPVVYQNGHEYHLQPDGSYQ